jgi:hypothetical protein
VIHRWSRNWARQRRRAQSRPALPSVNGKRRPHSGVPPPQGTARRLPPSLFSSPLLSSRVVKKRAESLLGRRRAARSQQRQSRRDDLPLPACIAGRVPGTRAAGRVMASAPSARGLFVRCVRPRLLLGSVGRGRSYFHFLFFPAARGATG